MILVDTKTATQTSAFPSLIALPLEEGDSKITLSFSELLQGLTTKSGDEVIQNGALVLALSKDVKGIDMVPITKETPLELNPQITQNLSPTELKVLVADAKKYLKTKIIESEGFKKAEIQKLPKTLKGLVAVAKKFGLDMSKITVEEIKVDPKIIAKVEKPELLKEIAKPQKTLKDVITSKEPQTFASVKSVKQEKVAEPLKTLKDVIASKEPRKVIQDVLESKVVVKEPVKQTKADITVNIDTDVKEVQNITRETRVKELPKKIKSTPLFKAQTKIEISTEQIVNAKINTITEIQTPKQKADNTLKALLHGKKVTQKEIGFTPDFAVATARVIAPQTTTEAKKSLESLLRGEQNDTTTASKIDGLNVSKADSFEVKIHESKQMTKYLSQDVKTAIEDYKAPFTRIKVQLNPQRLGEVDLTIVQRGKNLHINLTSNNAAINTLALNANDLKVQLTNNGINNASLNFNNNSSDSSQSGFGQQQQNSQHGREAKDEYSYFDNEEKNEEILNSLEIVVPNYA